MTTLLLERRVSPPAHLALIEPLGGLIAVYLLVNLALPQFVTGGWNLYLVQPALWLGLAAWCWRSGYPILRPSRIVLSAAILMGLFHLAAFAGAGAILGFGQSPYARSVSAIGGNSLYLASFLLATELIRGRLLQPAASPIKLIVVTLLLAVLTLPFGQWRGLVEGGTNPFLFSGERLIPTIVQSAIATSLLVQGGPWAALAYRLIVVGGEWLTPALPILTWSQTALVSTAVAAVAAQVLRPHRVTEGASNDLPAWASIGAVLLVGLIWLNTGLLGVRPAIISGISMEPSLHQGDIVFTREVAAGSLRQGDVIWFDEGGVPVLHRIRQVQPAPTGLVFITQGDNNVYPDAPVPASEVEGRVVFTIPKLGLIPITLRSWIGR